MPSYLENYLLALAGFLFHFLKMWYTSTMRKEGFLTKPTVIWAIMNILASAILVYIGGTLPPDLIVMSPLTCVMMGVFGSSMLSGFINVKKPKDLETLTVEGTDGLTKVTVEKQTITPKTP